MCTYTVSIPSVKEIKTMQEVQKKKKILTRNFGAELFLSLLWVPRKKPTHHRIHIRWSTVAQVITPSFAYYQFWWSEQPRCLTWQEEGTLDVTVLVAHTQTSCSHMTPVPKNWRDAQGVYLSYVRGNPGVGRLEWGTHHDDAERVSVLSSRVHKY